MKKIHLKQDSVGALCYIIIIHTKYIVSEMVEITVYESWYTHSHTQL